MVSYRLYSGLVRRTLRWKRCACYRILKTSTAPTAWLHIKHWFNANYKFIRDYWMFLDDTPSTDMTSPERCIFLSSDCDPYLVSLWSWPLNFWPQDAISSSLSQMHQSCKFGDNPTKQFLRYHANELHVALWRCGRASDLRSRGRGFESRPGMRHKNLGQVSHTYMHLSPTSISWYWPKGSDAWRLGR